MIKTIKMRILLLEDNTFDADFTCRAIVKEIPESVVEVATSLKDARNLLQNNTFDAAILDVNLPDGSGLELLIEIREKQLPMTVLVLTGYSDQELAVAAIKAGANDFVIKDDNYHIKLTQAIVYHRNSISLKKEGQRIRVLYLEHHQADLDLTLRHFRKYAPNFNIEQISDGQKLLKRLEEAGNNEGCDIILLDYRLPGIDGLAITKIIRQELKLDIPIVIITGQGNEEVAINALNLGVDDYLVKRENYVLRLPSLLQNVYQRCLLAKQQKELEKSEQHYRLIAENADDVIFTLDMNLNYTYVSPSVYKLRGFSPEEVINTSIVDALSAESYTKALQELHKALHPDPELQHISTGPITMDLELLKKDKSIIWVEINASLLKDENKIPYGVLGVTRDISEKKHAQLELIKSHVEYKMFFEDDLTGDYLATVEGKLLNCNPAYLKILGLKSKEEALNLNLYSIYPTPNDRDHILKEIRKHGKLINYEFNMLHSNGAVIHVISNITGIFDESGVLISLRGYLIDNTDRKRDEESLLKLSHAVEQSPVSIVITDTNGNIEYCNPKMSEVTGYQIDELIGKTPRIFNSGEKPKSEYQNLWHTISSGQEWFGEFHNKKKNGALYWEAASISPIKNEMDKITHYVAVKEDITIKKQFDEVQNIILEISQLSVQNITQNSFLSELHNKLKKILRAENFYMALYDKTHDTYIFPYFIDEEDDFKINHPYNLSGGYTDYVRKTGKGKLITQEVKLELEKNKEMTGHGQAPSVWLGVPLKSSITNEVYGVIAVQDYHNLEAYSENDLRTFEIIASNIGVFIERVKTFEELSIAKVKAEESDRLKSAFLANMSHEIRTPMNGILGFSELLKNPELSGKQQKEYIDIIGKSGKRMLNIITDIVDISKIESGLMKVNYSNTNINTQIEDLYDFFVPEAEKKGLQLSFITGLLKEEAVIETDIDKLDAILTNLVKNAIKYTEKGNIEFGYKIVDSVHEPHIQFFVKDTGIGIPGDRQEAIFERFIQADIADKMARQGAGLGLTISRAYVEMLGGKLWIESKEKGGSTFYFTLPYNPLEVTPKAIKNEILDDLKETQTNNLKILVVEDDETSGALLSIELQELAKEIIMALTGIEAVEACRHQPDIDLVLMDIQIPEINGYEATRQIRQFNKEVIIIAQTAYALAGDREKALKAGCDDYISKPINKAELLALIGKYFNK